MVKGLRQLSLKVDRSIRQKGSCKPRKTNMESNLIKFVMPKFGQPSTFLHVGEQPPYEAYLERFGIRVAFFFPRLFKSMMGIASSSSSANS